MERESSLDERLRKDQERADYVRDRQIRLGHVPDPEEESNGEKSSPKPKPRARAKSKAK